MLLLYITIIRELFCPYVELRGDGAVAACGERALIGRDEAWSRLRMTSAAAREGRECARARRSRPRQSIDRPIMRRLSPRAMYRAATRLMPNALGARLLHPAFRTLRVSMACRSGMHCCTRNCLDRNSAGDRTAGVGPIQPKNVRRTFTRRRNAAEGRVRVAQDRHSPDRVAFSGCRGRCGPYRGSAPSRL